MERSWDRLILICVFITVSLFDLDIDLGLIVLLQLWDVNLCQKDSNQDGQDGRTNREELGDPNCMTFNLSLYDLDLILFQVWDVNLCQKDSDQDGRTKGEEIGDPNCMTFTFPSMTLT